eukprot:4218757-Pleurochrysis_carterae.AAC.1
MNKAQKSEDSKVPDVQSGTRRRVSEGEQRKAFNAEAAERRLAQSFTAPFATSGIRLSCACVRA